MSKRVINAISATLSLINLLSHNIQTSDINGDVTHKAEFIFKDLHGYINSIDTLPAANIDILIIHFKFNHFFHSINLSNERPNQLETAIRYFDKTDRFCINKMENYFICEMIGRTVVVRGYMSLKFITIFGYDTEYDKNVGCSVISTTIPSQRVRHLNDCRLKCLHELWFAVTEDKSCRCLPDLSTATLVHLSLCNSMCTQYDAQICGGRGYHSVYLKDEPMFHSHVASKECLFSNEHCHTCPPGRKGFSCEILDCSINNGGCGNLDCQEIKVSTNIVHSVCVCNWMDWYKPCYVEKYASVQVDNTTSNINITIRVPQKMPNTVIILFVVLAILTTAVFAFYIAFVGKTASAFSSAKESVS